jgi:hypothetical protein
MESEFDPTNSDSPLAMPWPATECVVAHVCHVLCTLVGIPTISDIDPRIPASELYPNLSVHASRDCTAIQDTARPQ